MILVHSGIAKLLEQTKLGREVTMQGCEKQLHIHQAINISNVVGDVTNNSGIVKMVKIIETIKNQNIGGELTVKGVGSESQLCQQFWSGRYEVNTSQQILGQVYNMDGNTIVESTKYYFLECGIRSSSSRASRHTMYFFHMDLLASDQRRRRVAR